MESSSTFASNLCMDQQGIVSLDGSNWWQSLGMENLRNFWSVVRFSGDFSTGTKIRHLVRLFNEPLPMPRHINQPEVSGAGPSSPS